MTNSWKRYVPDDGDDSAIVGSRSHDLLEAVLQADYENPDHNLFGDDDGDGILNVNEAHQKIGIEDDDGDGDEDVFTMNIQRGRYAKSSGSRAPATPSEGRSRSRRPEEVRQGGLAPMDSPLARSFTHRRRPAEEVHRHPSSEDMLTSMKRVEGMLAERGTLTKDMKEMSERQTRIEALLMSLTREMRS